MSGNPYSVPVQPTKQQMLIAGGGVHPMTPLDDAAGWLTFPGWYLIIFGIICCLSIIGIVIGWLPILMGNLLKDAADKLRSGFATSENGQLCEASRRLATLFTILAIPTIVALA